MSFKKQHPSDSYFRRQAAFQVEGCLPGIMLPPIVALLLGLTLGGWAIHSSLFSVARANAMTADNSMPQIVSQTPGLSAIFTPEIQWWGKEIVAWAAQYDIDPNLVATVMQIESCGDPSARSSAGAMGLFQVMPFHFYNTDDPYDPDTNAARGLAYLRRSLDAAGGNPDLALAGYNGGIGIISRPEYTWAEETQRYLYWGSGIYHDAQAGLIQSARLDEWRARAGGLCARASQQIGIP
jgi:soluble lytic murein transglycosylase-like protein